jgi:hypothetical protein
MARTPTPAPTPAPTSASDRINVSGLQLSWQHIRCLATDPIDMDHLFAVDPELNRQVTALRLETDAQVHQAMAAASSQAAKMLKSSG